MIPCIEIDSEVRVEIKIIRNGIWDSRAGEKELATVNTEIWQQFVAEGRLGSEVKCKWVDTIRAARRSKAVYSLKFVWEFLDQPAFR